MSRKIDAKIGIRRRGKLFRRYLRYMTILVLCCVILVGGFIMVFLSKYWMDSRQQVLLSDASSIATLTELYVKSNQSGEGLSESDDIRIILSSALKTASLSSESDIYICNNNGKVLICKELLADNVSDVDDSVCDEHAGIVYPSNFINNVALNKSIALRCRLAGIYEEPTFLAASGIYYEGKMVGFVVAVQPAAEGLKGYVADFSGIICFAMALALVICFIITYILTFSVTQPMTEMSTVMREYSQGDFSQRIKPHGNDEIAELAENFNKMADALAVNENSRRSFVANVSHELRTPMTSIGGFVDGMLDGTIPPSQQKHYLTIVSNEVKRLTRLITSMLNMSKIEAGELTLNATDFNISELIFTTLLSFEKKLNDKNIDIEGLDKFRSIIVNADEGMINQVVYNLIENAVKYTPNDEKICLMVDDSSHKINVKIRNYGVGISQKECKMIFERFYKVDRSRSLDVKSVGLGLYICKSIVELHGGTIGVNSDGSTYTEFEFTIPDRQR